VRAKPTLIYYESLNYQPANRARLDE